MRVHIFIFDGSTTQEKFALMSVSVGVFKPSEQKRTRVEGNS